MECERMLTLEIQSSASRLSNEIFIGIGTDDSRTKIIFIKINHNPPMTWIYIWFNQVSTHVSRLKIMKFREP